MEIVEISRDSISEIEHLWCELNELHFIKSDNFKDHYASFSFSDRIEKLLQAELLAVYAAKIGSELVGYCIASVTNDSGEVD
ncbi:hypothetical protein GT360_19545 [Vibrio astriarenae]|uniref:GNAT family N-acetyltransferase n=1 Tax=Vibrio astriarenae TaxID=1481923 RepID=A0A7Z2YFP2_9VIBR|nr:hypothetical protein [Vibrio astriarenae]QIA65717.1 hypothetical protein GT360_19545 [Vibrio astriarenae]